MRSAEILGKNAGSSHACRDSFESFIVTELRKSHLASRVAREDVAGHGIGQWLVLSHQGLFDVASTSSGQCWSLTPDCPVPGPVPTSPSNRDYKPGFAAALMLKDLKLSQQAAQAAGAVTPLGAEATQLYALFEAMGHGGTDFSGIIRFLRGDVA